MADSFTAGATQLAGHAALLLGWRPTDFWSATPAELASALSGLASAAPEAAGATPTDLNRLMERYPDG